MSLQIDTKVSLAIFEEPLISERVDKLFMDTEEDFKEKIKEIFSILHLVLLKDGAIPNDLTLKKRAVFVELSYENIFRIFKVKFCESIAIKSIQLAFNSSQYNILDNIASLLSKEELSEAINGNLMWNTFMSIVEELPLNRDTSQFVNSLIFLMHKNKNVICK